MPTIFAYTSTVTAPVDPNAAADGSFQSLILYVLVALGVSFLCSILEASLLSTSLSYIEVQLQDGNRASKWMQKHKQNVERPIVAILTLNTIAHTVGAAGAGAEATAIFGSEFIGIISAILTLLILVFSEIIPKTLGAVYWKQLFTPTGYILQFMVISLYPFVIIFEKLTNTLRPEEYEPTVTRSELEAMVVIGTAEGMIQEREHRILRNLLHLQNVQVKDIMTPRTVVMALQQNLTVTEVVKIHPVLPYSRIPIYNTSTDDIAAYVLRHNIYKQITQGNHNKKLHEFSIKLQAVPETNAVATVLDEFITKQEHIFLVFDEYGGTSGILTLEDTIETLLGIEITDESDLVADLRQVAQQRFQRQLLNLEPLTSDPDSTEEQPPESD